MLVFFTILSLMEFQVRYYLAYFRKTKHLGIGGFIESARFDRNFFLNLNKVCQKHILIWGMHINIFNIFSSLIFGGLNLFA